MNDQPSTAEPIDLTGMFEHDLWFKALEIRSLCCGINRVSEDALNHNGDADEALQHVLNLAKIGMDLAGRLGEGLEEASADIRAALKGHVPTEKLS